MGRAELFASLPETALGSHAGLTQGSAKPSWAPFRPSKSGSLWLKEKRKKLSIETVSGGWVTPEAELHSPAWPGSWEWEWNQASEIQMLPTPLKPELFLISFFFPYQVKFIFRNKGLKIKFWKALN